jgi:isoleucyl-tRNA synthetase
MPKFPQYENLNLSEIGKEILEKWAKESTFEKSVSLREGAKTFTFYEGPPSANGMPGIHHVMARTIKDIFCRYHTMKGFKVERKGGWDTHGLPIELSVEKSLGITKEDIGKKITVEEYNAACRREVMKYKDKWEEVTTKMGYWVDMKDPYITFDNNYIESVWYLLGELYKKKMLYKGYTIQPYSWAAGTGLSSHELNQPGTYKNLKDTTVTAQFKVIQNDKSKFLFDGSTGTPIFFLAWTTTPWTLPSNCALAVGNDIEYALISTYQPYQDVPIKIIIAKELLPNYFVVDWEDVPNSVLKVGLKRIKEEHIHKGRPNCWEILNIYKGSELEGIHYEQLLKPATNVYIQGNSTAEPFRVLIGDFVTTDDGTGIVHIAPSFGADDFNLAKKYNIGHLTFVNKEGRFTEDVADFAGLHVKTKADQVHPENSTDLKIALKLKKEGKAFKVEKYEHSYPHCWRTDEPIIYYPLDSWFIKTTAAKDKMIELNKTVNWKPESTGTGRFGNWLENLVDWNLSRSRFWGIPLPIWTKHLPSNSIEDKYACIDSYKELEANGYYFSDELLNKFNSITNNVDPFAVQLQNDGIYNIWGFMTERRLLNESKYGQYLTDNGFDAKLVQKYLTSLKDLPLQDFHKPFIDRVIILKNDSIYIREPDLIDVWFDSGSMPYAQWHYPFENTDKFKENFPADFIAEGVDQTRGWFFTLHAIASMLFDSVAFKNVVSNGLVLDKHGNKMSKRLGNAVDPFKIIEQYGADATRWYLISNAQPWDNLKFDEEGITEVQRKLFRALYNTYAFYALYANIDGFTYSEKEIPVDQRPELDQWILSVLNSLIKRVDEFYATYEPMRAARDIEAFVTDQLSNWYVRLSRRRFWKGEYSEDKIAAFQTLYTCLETIAKLIAPIAPFFSEKLFTDLNDVSGKEKVQSIHHSLFPAFDGKNINPTLEERMDLAQRISSITLALRKKVNIRVRQPLNKILIPILEENLKHQIDSVKSLILAEVNVKELHYVHDTDGMLNKKIKANFKELGKKLGPLMKDAATTISNFGREEIKHIEKTGKYSINLSGREVEILLTDVEITSEDMPGWHLMSDGKLTVALDIIVTKELEEEGIARELVNRIQNLRKDKNYEVTDKISVQIKQNKALETPIKNNFAYICSEILATSFEMVDNLDEGQAIVIEVISPNPLEGDKGISASIFINKSN